MVITISTSLTLKGITPDDLASDAGKADFAAAVASTITGVEAKHIKNIVAAPTTSRRQLRALPDLLMPVARRLQAVTGAEVSFDIQIDAATLGAASATALHTAVTADLTNAVTGGSGMETALKGAFPSMTSLDTSGYVAPSFGDAAVVFVATKTPTSAPTMYEGDIDTVYVVLALCGVVGLYFFGECRASGGVEPDRRSSKPILNSNKLLERIPCALFVLLRAYSLTHALSAHTCARTLIHTT